MDAQLNNGPQPIIDIMAAHKLIPHDLVAASDQQMTHKMIKRACSGRRLTQNVKLKVKNAINNATKEHYTLKDIFNY